MPQVALTCTWETFCPHDDPRVRWLDWEADFALAQSMWPPESPLTLAVWNEARTLGYRYCALIEAQQAVALAAVWRYSDDAWEAAAVRTRPEFRRRGYGRAVVSFVTAHILAAGRVATCHTGADNAAMIGTAERVGFARS
jgi:GNAT superfamily N-acetyltransferase